MATPSNKSLRRGLRRIEMGAQNALELLRFGRLEPREGTPFEVVHAERTYRLRRYPLPDGRKPRLGAPLLLVPPLMITAEVYDMAPDISSVAALGRDGIDVFLVDFGAPEEEEGGMERTLDDHVRAVADAIRRVKETTGHDVHVAGYSQGGMFVYQAAAYVGCKDVASLITFGSPVDIHRNLPGVSPGALEQIIRAASSMASRPLADIEGLPGFLTSTGFKLLSLRKELAQLVDFVGKLAGGGFVAWPGPALRKFIEEFVVHNRMISGGFVIDGRTVTLAAIDKPVLCFVGDRDEIARPEAVTSIREAAPSAEVYEIHLLAGHFGLVVGSTALEESWPTVVQWLEWREQMGPRPALIPAPVPPAVIEPEDADLGADLDFDLFYDAAIDTALGLWRRLGEATEDAGDLFDSLRYQLPKLTFLERLDGETRTSAALELARRARSIPERTFFLWEGRALTFADAERRVDNVVKGLWETGIRRGQRVGVRMTGRPSFLTTVTALNRMGAVAVVLPPTFDDATLARAARLGEISVLVTDPEGIEQSKHAFDGRILVLGGGGAKRTLPEGVLDMEAIDPDRVVLPSDFVPNGGRARDLALVLFRATSEGELRAVSITNGRWAFSAYGAAAACTLTPSDTVYSWLPLHHPTGMLVTVGSALVSGARLALGARFHVEEFWEDVHRYGVTVAYYAGEMGRALSAAPKERLEERTSLRMLAGSGLRPDVWERLRLRMPKLGILEFYAASEVNLVLANASGKKVGAIGRPLPGSVDIDVASYDFSAREFRRDPWGRFVRAAVDEPGILIARLDGAETGHSGIIDADRLGARVKRDVFAPGDAWYVTGDVVRRDGDGDYHYVDRVEDVIRTSRGAIMSRDVEDVIYEEPSVALCAVYGRKTADGVASPEAVIVPAKGATIDRSALLARLEARLAEHERPTRIHVASELPMTEAMRPLKSALAARKEPPGTPL